jgi:hypothetical protein
MKTVAFFLVMAAAALPAAGEPSFEDKLRASLILCMKVGASPEGRQDCARVLRAARALSRKKQPAAAPEPAAGQVEGFLASLDAASGTKTAAQLEAEFEAIARSLPVRRFKPQYARHFPPPAAPAGAPGAAENREEPRGPLTAEGGKALTDKAAAMGRTLLPDKKDPGPPVNAYSFNAKAFPGFYDAKNDMPTIDKKTRRERGYNIPQIRKDIPRMWASYGAMFKKIGAAEGMDPYALAAFCVFESYNDAEPSRKNPRGRNFNPRMRDDVGGLGCGIAATQAKSEAECSRYRNDPELSARALAREFKERMSEDKDLAKTIWRVAYPAWGDPSRARGNYGNMAQYVSRAYVLYEAFRAADKTAAAP